MRECTVLTDERPIKCLSFDTEDGAAYLESGGYSFEAYGEPGMHCDIPFFRVIKDGVVVARVPATHVTVVYA